MFARLYSFKFIISAALLWLGALAYGLAIYSTQVYRGQAIDHHRQSIESLLEIETRSAIDDLYAELDRFALWLRATPEFEQALAAGDAQRLESWLSRSFALYPDAVDQLHLKSIAVRNLAGDVIAHTSDDGLRNYWGCASTPPGGGDALRLIDPRHSLCSRSGGLFTEVVTPVGNAGPGYTLQVLAHAVDGLRQIERSIDIPLQITDRQGQRLYQSDHWNDAQDRDHGFPTYTLYGDDSFVGARITAAFDQQPIIARLEDTETNFFIITTVATVSALLLVILMLNRALQPMNKLRNSVGALLTGKYASISEDKLPSELRDLVIAYNEMVEGLETETISRRQIEEKLRSEKDFISTTLDSISNPVIVIDSKDRIKLVNPSAEKLFGDREAALIDTPIHEVLILYANRQTTRIVDLRQLLDGKLSVSSMFFYDPDRNIVELEFSASPMIDMEAEDVGFVIILKDVSEDRKLRRKLSYEGSHDQLTGFLNRSAFEQKFENLVTENNNDEPQHVLAYLDLDQFRVINETCGNAAGDQLLKQTAGIIRRHVRKSDFSARLSGDEFGIIMPFFEMERALQTIQKIIIDIQHTGFNWNDQFYSVTASIGVMAFGLMSDDYSDYYSKVTTACFLAKQNGGNQYHFIDENDEKVKAQQVSMEWVSGIMEGITQERFRLYVQPIVSIDENNQRDHYEVLIRYRNPDGRIFPPNDFLPPAERYNLIERIDSWVVSSVIAWLKRHQHRLNPAMFSINLSGRSIGSHTFHKFLHDSLTESELDLSWLCFEITETAAVDNVERSIEFINSIRALGAKFSLDDFGTGLSSFSYLKQFPVDFLKIDGEFVRDITDDDKSYVFVRSMTEVGHCLDMKVIAEFVESDTMFDKLREANVDYIQGYTVGKPVEISTLLESEEEIAS